MITLTDAAAKKVKSSLSKRGKGLGIRIGVKTTGCSGLAYVLEYVDYYNPLDEATVISNDVTIVVSPKHEPYLRDMTVDYVRHGLNEGFEFSNPNERDRCGCGESFRV
jgi:iron-sulfur cluster assembly protein